MVRERPASETGPKEGTPLAGGIGWIGMTADGEAGAQIYAAAAKREQAAQATAEASDAPEAVPA